MMFSLTAPNTRALIVSDLWHVKSDLDEFLTDLGVPALVTNIFDDIPFLYLADYEPSHLFVSVDEYGGPALLYNELRSLRTRMPNTAIILISSEFSTDEFGTHRLYLADVSLRYPFSRQSIFYGLKQAQVNLAIWKKRMVDLAEYHLSTTSAQISY